MIGPILFLCTPVALWDADGPIWCKEGPRIRIAGIAARESDGTCLRNHPCPAMGPQEARQRTIEAMGARVTGKRRTGHLTVTGPMMQCRAYGRSAKRVVASCTVGGRDLGCAIIASGAAVEWPRYWRQYGLPPCK